METVPAQDIALSGTLLFYEKPELLSKETHANLGVNPADVRFGFAGKANVCPITVPEFGPASLCYPIIFVGDTYQPVVVMGLEENQNLFTTEDGGLEVDCYVPCYVRRYPFVLAGGPPTGQADERMLICIDRGYPYIVENAQFPFFENGEPTEYTQNCIKFCEDFEAQRRSTDSFVALLKDLGLFETRSTTYTPTQPDGTQGEPVTLAQYYGVSEDKLNALSHNKLAELRGNGALQQIYVHLNSLLAWERLIIRAQMRSAAKLTAAANA